ncbi:hypothetical protein [Janibacter corallicola]|uniref:hypothetical protein n=1 Tax=Janibacter corallicola TaxID=415212 RepID=UPI00082E4DF9|nr:hypothetical protein [Janibacter corallicola]
MRIEGTREDSLELFRQQGYTHGIHDHLGQWRGVGVILPGVVGWRSRLLFPKAAVTQDGPTMWVRWGSLDGQVMEIPAGATVLTRPDVNDATQ